MVGDKYNGYGYESGPIGMVTLNEQLSIKHDNPKDIDIKLNEMDQFLSEEGPVETDLLTQECCNVRFRLQEQELDEEPMPY
mgnify:FL=1